jgi:hypothetical protein
MGPLTERLGSIGPAYMHYTKAVAKIDFDNVKDAYEIAANLEHALKYGLIIAGILLHHLGYPNSHGFGVNLKKKIGRLKLIYNLSIRFSQQNNIRNSYWRLDDWISGGAIYHSWSLRILNDEPRCTDDRITNVVRREYLRRILKSGNESSMSLAFRTDRPLFE